MTVAAVLREKGPAVIAVGPDVKVKGALGELDMRDIAPSIARVLGVEAPNPGRKPVF